MYTRNWFYLILIVLLLSIPGLNHAQDSGALLKIRQERFPVSLRNPVNPSDSLLHLYQDSAMLAAARQFHSPYGSHALLYMLRQPEYNIRAAPRQFKALERTPPQLEWVFYLFCGLLLLLAFLRIAFDKYFIDLFHVFFNSSLRQKQIRDQLQQAPLPALLLNIFFVVSGGVFLYFLLQYYQWQMDYNRWILIGLCILALSFLYVGKYFILKLSGWVFDRELAADIYIFIVFLVNKVMGLFLLPMAIIIAFSSPSSQGLMVKISLVGIGALLIYRFVRSYHALRNELKISQLHFVLYLCAFELVPVLLIYRVLMRIF